MRAVCISSVNFSNIPLPHQTVNSDDLSRLRNIEFFFPILKRNGGNSDFNKSPADFIARRGGERQGDTALNNGIAIDFGISVLSVVTRDGEKKQRH